MSRTCPSYNSPTPEHSPNKLCPACLLAGGDSLSSPDPSPTAGKAGDPIQRFTAATKIASSATLADLGPPAGALCSLDLPEPQRPDSRTIQGEIIHINRFGNLVTNIHQSLLEGATVKSVSVGSLPLPRICNTYADVPVGSPLALFGADGRLEIAHNGDNAAQRLGLKKASSPKSPSYPNAQ